MTTILVLGATGKTGRDLVPALLSRGFDVRAATRNPASFDGASDATVVRFDWNDRQTWAPALAGVDAVYLVKPEIENAAEIVREFLEQVTRAGSSRLVLHSEVAAQTRSDSDEERRVELAVERTDLDWTIVRPNWFVQDLADNHFFGGMIRDDGIIAMTTGGSGVAWIDTRDIAAAAVELLSDPGLYRHEALTLTGPESLTLEALTERIEAITGRSVVPLEEPIDAAEERMRREDLPGDSVAYLTRLNLSIVSGETAVVTNSVEKLTGRPPRTIDSFLAEWAPQLAAQAPEGSSGAVKVNEALFRRQVAAWSRFDIDALLDCYNDDMVYVDVPFPDEIVHGKDAFRVYLNGYFTQFDKSEFGADVVTLVANETHAIGELLCTGRYIGAGAPDGGIVLRWYATLVDTIVAGKISSERAYFDPTLIEEAVADASEATGDL